MPTPAEALQIKAFLCTERQATRDYLDVAALADLLGEEETERALASLNVLYEGEGNQSRVSRFAEVSQQDPVDLEEVNLSTYQGLQPPYDDWDYVKKRVSRIGVRLLELEMQGMLPAPPGGGPDAIQAGSGKRRTGTMTPRITTEPDLLYLVDTISRGSTADWQELYRGAERSAEVRREIRRALDLVEPELDSSRVLWNRLLSRIEERTES